MRILLLALVMGLAGCGDFNMQNMSANRAQYITLDDGRPCVVLENRMGTYPRGISCDWNYTPPKVDGGGE